METTRRDATPDRFGHAALLERIRAQGECLTVSLVRIGEEEDRVLSLEHCWGWREALSAARDMREDGAFHKSVRFARSNGVTRVEVSR